MRGIDQYCHIETPLTKDQSRIWFNNLTGRDFVRRILFTLLLLAIPFSAARASTDHPGDSCASTPNVVAGSWELSPYYTNGQVINGMFCNGSTWQSAINFQSTGNIGIGTTTPAQLLNVVGNLQIGTGANDTVGRQLLLYGKSLAPPSITMTSQPDQVLMITGQGGGNAGTISDSYNFTINFATSGSTTSPFNIQYNGNNALTILSSNGYVGIGKTSPQAALDVAGSIQYSGTLSDVSDRRLKHAIKPMPPGQLGKIEQLQPVSYVLNTDPKQQVQLGFIAQDVQPLYPDLVLTNSDGIHSLNYVGMIAPVVAAMQEQQREIRFLWAGLIVVTIAGFAACFVLWRGKRR